jgi:hypothetical protein
MSRQGRGNTGTRRRPKGSPSLFVRMVFIKFTSSVMLSLLYGSEVCRDSENTRTDLKQSLLCKSADIFSFAPCGCSFPTYLVPVRFECTVNTVGWQFRIMWHSVCR